MTSDLSSPRFYLPSTSFHALADIRLPSRASLELMKKCFQHQFLILLSVICYIVVLRCVHSLEPCSIHLTSIHLLLYFLITASHNIHSCNALLSFLIIYISTQQNVHNKPKCKARNDLSAASMKRKVFLRWLFSFHQRKREK